MSEVRIRRVGQELRIREAVLLCHRVPGAHPYAERWDLPGGHVERGEEPRDALVRELAEELGIEIQPPEGPPDFEILRSGMPSLQGWFVRRWIGTPGNTEPDEHDGVAWFPVGALPEDALAHPHLATVLRSANP